MSLFIIDFDYVFYINIQFRISSEILHFLVVDEKNCVNVKCL